MQAPDVNKAAEVLDDEDSVGENNALVRRTSDEVAVGSLGGSTDGAGLRLPWLKIAHGVGKLSDNFHPGDLVLNEEALLVEKNVPIGVIVVKAVIYWKEYLSPDMFNAGMQARKFLTIKEVQEAGGSTEWVNKPVKIPPTFSEAIDMSILIRKPKDLICGYFGMPFDGEEYAPAMVSFDKTAAKRVIPVLKMAEGFTLKNRVVDGTPVGLLGATFNLSTLGEKVKRASGETTVFRPSFKFATPNSDGLVQFIRSFFPTHAKPAETTEEGAEV